MYKMCKLRMRMWIFCRSNFPRFLLLFLSMLADGLGAGAKNQVFMGKNFFIPFYASLFIGYANFSNTSNFFDNRIATQLPIPVAGSAKNRVTCHSNATKWWNLPTMPGDTSKRRWPRHWPVNATNVSIHTSKNPDVT